jgi:hypothetical protein
MRSSQVPVTRKELSPKTVRWIWAAALADVMAVVWMYAAGEWFDAHLVTSVITLGGHHRLVLWLAGVGFGTITVIAVATEGFASTGRVESTAICLACLASAVALAGFLSVIALIAGIALLLGITGRLIG